MPFFDEGMRQGRDMEQIEQNLLITIQWYAEYTILCRLYGEYGAGYEPPKPITSLEDITFPSVDGKSTVKCRLSYCYVTEFNGVKLKSKPIYLEGFIWKGCTKEKIQTYLCEHPEKKWLEKYAQNGAYKYVIVFQSGKMFLLSPEDKIFGVDKISFTL